MAYDVFISFKNSDENGRITRDSEIAKKLYDFLTDKGLSVFFSNEVLERLGKAQYTRVIDEALDSARILIAIGCSHDNLNSQWVRYEWESFINDVRSGIKSNAEIFVLYEGVRLSELPRALRQQQAFDAGEAVSYEKLYNFIRNALGMGAASSPVQAPAPAPLPEIPEMPAVKEAASSVNVDPVSTNIQNYSIGSTIRFGSFDWLVLDVQDGKALIITKDIIEMQPFNSIITAVGWEDCTLRKYLNGAFFNRFSADERSKGVQTNESGVNDFVFLLSLEEAQRYFPDNDARRARDNGEYCGWFLRSRGYDDVHVSIVYSDGSVDYDGSHGVGNDGCNFVDSSVIGVRPAMWIKPDEVE